MSMKYIKIVILAVILAVIADSTFAHGLVVNPPARNANCGVDEKPDNATSADCIAAFAEDFNGGYQFMSVLTHDVGRQGVTPLPENVCGFNSETWDNYNNGSTTPWDNPNVPWRTTNVSPGQLDVVWDIQWGPHFDDTEEFVSYITKPDFQYQEGVPLTWNDFEEAPFCKETYDDKNPGANPNVSPDKANAKFTVKCNLPARTGRHVMYNEWGRNFFTFERFHNCSDLQFSGDNGGGGNQNVLPVANSQTVSLDENTSLTIGLTGSDSDGTVSAYNVASQPNNGSLSGTGQSVIYTPNNNFTGNDSFTFTVTDNEGGVSSAATVTITVNSATGDNLAPTANFTYSASNLAVGFDASSSNDPDAGPQALSYAWDFGNGQSGTGVNPSYTYAAEGTYDVTLTVSDGDLSDSITKAVTVTAPITGGDGAQCEYVVTNSWNSGFTAEIRLTNTGSQTISGWDVSWSYTDGSAVTNLWNASLTGTGSGPYSASNLSWNANITPGQTVAFGFQGSSNGSTSPATVTGAICN